MSESNLFTAICAAQFYYFYLIITHDSIFPQIALTLFFGTWLGYSLLLHIRLTHKQLISICFICIPPLLYLSYLLTLKEITLFISILLLTFLYNPPFYIMIKLRNIPFLKPFVVSLSWAMIGTVFIKWKLILFADAFLFIFPLAVLYDLRDRDIDSKQLLKTFANQMRERKLKFFLAILWSLHLAIEFNLKLPLGYLILTTLYFLGVLISATPRKEREFFTIGVDGIIFLRPILLLLFQQQ